MAQNSAEPCRESAVGEVHDGDSKTITDLIEQLERDLAETQKNTSDR